MWTVWRSTARTPQSIGSLIQSGWTHRKYFKDRSPRRTAISDILSHWTGSQNQSFLSRTQTHVARTCLAQLLFVAFKLGQVGWSSLTSTPFTKETNKTMPPGQFICTGRWCGRRAATTVERFATFYWDQRGLLISSFPTALPSFDFMFIYCTKKHRFYCWNKQLTQARHCMLKNIHRILGFGPIAILHGVHGIFCCRREQLLKYYTEERLKLCLGPSLIKCIRSFVISDLRSVWKTSTPAGRNVREIRYWSFLIKLSTYSEISKHIAVQIIIENFNSLVQINVPWNS